MTRAQQLGCAQAGQGRRNAAWRIGLVAGARDLADACPRELEWDLVRVSHVAQRAAQTALQGLQDRLDATSPPNTPQTATPPTQSSPGTRS
jgi:hypothetical protein